MVTTAELSSMAHSCRVKARERMAVDLAIAVQEYLASGISAAVTRIVEAEAPATECPKCILRRKQTAARVARCKRRQKEREGQ